MKKQIILMLWVFVMYAVLSAGTIALSSPNGGETWILGNSKVIRWSGSGLTNPVKITLWKSGTLVGLIVKDQPANGTYSWTVGSFIGGTATCDSNYKIKIREQGGVSFTTEDMSYRVFTIIGCDSESPELEIISIDKEGSAPIGVGDMVNVILKVRNNGGGNAVIYPATVSIGLPIKVISGRRGAIGGYQTRDYVFVFPIGARHIDKNGGISVRIFLADAAGPAPSASTILKIIYKDSNMNNHQKTWNYVSGTSRMWTFTPNRTLTEIDGTHDPRRGPLKETCPKNMPFPSYIIKPPGGQVALGKEMIYKKDYPRFPCENWTTYRFRSAINFDLSSIRDTRRITKAELKFKSKIAASSYRTSFRKHFKGTGDGTVLVYLLTRTWSPGVRKFITPYGGPYRQYPSGNPDVGRLESGGSLDVIRQVRNWVANPDTNFGFHLSIYDVIPDDVRGKLSTRGYAHAVAYYKFKLEVTLSSN